MSHAGITIIFFIFLYDKNQRASIITFCPSLTLNASLEVGSPVWTKLILPSSRSFREKKSIDLEENTQCDI